MLRKVLLFFVITKTQPPQPAQTRIRITTRRRLSKDAFIYFITLQLFFCFGVQEDLFYPLQLRQKYQ
jgi:hypothetical protein